jgi:hypothetical protein
MTEQEAQQAQTIAEIKAIRNGGEYPREYYREAIDKAIEIVDSQAQKIAEQEAMVELGRSSLQTATDLLKSKNAEIEQQAQKLLALVTNNKDRI